MKLLFKITIILCFISSSCFIAGAQNNSSYSINKQIVTLSSDTLNYVNIIKNFRLTNEDKISYKKDGKVHTLTANDIQSYFDGEDLFKPFQVESGSQKKLISFPVFGTLSFGQSFNEKGERVFYVKKAGNNAVINLYPHRKNLKAFFENYLPDFKTFSTGRKIYLNYDFKALAEFASAYNAYAEPDKYKAANYKNPDLFKWGLQGAFNVASFRFENDSDTYKYKGAFNFGLQVEHFYSRNFSLKIISGINQASFASEKEKIKISAINGEAFIYLNKKINESSILKVGPGAGILYHLNSEINRLVSIPREQDVIKFEGFSFGYSFGGELEFNKKIGFTLNYSIYNLKSENIDLVQTEDSGKKARTNGLRMGFAYKF